MDNIRKLKFEEVKNFLSEQGYQLIDGEYVNNGSKLIYKDSQGYYYNTNFASLRKGIRPRIVHNKNPFTTQNIILWCKINGDLFTLFSDKYINNQIKLIWKCLDHECGAYFEQSWAQVVDGMGCPHCKIFKRVLEDNLATKNPNLSNEWNYDKNGRLTPQNVLCDSHLIVWWKCAFGHEWESSINNRNSGNGCRYCAERYPYKDYNLEVINPKIASEWNYTRNDKKPNEFTPNSHVKVWWICNNGHEWKATINSRSSIGNGCRICSETKGEKRIREFLEKKAILAIPQKEFQGLYGTGGGLLSYDFYLPDHNLLIEYQGEFHDGTGNNNYTKINLVNQQEHDRRKKEYALHNKIRLLEIWYYDFENIEDILEKHIANK